jgi:type IV secretory pathway VirB2 component (pilin)
MQAIVQNAAVKSFLALERAKDWTVSGQLTHRKAFVMGAAVAVAMIGGQALAQAPVGAGTVDTGTGNPIDRVRRTICAIAGVLQGPIGIGVIIVCVVVAGLSLAFGGRNSTSLLISALIGAAVIFGARTLVGFVSGGTVGACATT